MRWGEPLRRFARPFCAHRFVSPNRGDAPQGAEGSPRRVFHSVRRTPILFFRQYRIIRQGDLARNFSSQICCENAGILCVFQVFTADLWGKRTVKARRRNCAVLPLFFLLYSFSFAPTGGLPFPKIPRLYLLLPHHALSQQLHSPLKLLLGVLKNAVAPCDLHFRLPGGQQAVEIA